MRILVLGAGGLGGYFGGRLLRAGRDVTFLVRPKRAAQLAAQGLVIRSPRGDLDLPSPPTVTAETLGESGPYDLILFGCKAYDLEDAMAAIAPAVGPGTAILPLLNGLRHLELLQARFGTDAVLGGLCLISAVLDGDSRILHLNDAHQLVFGERGGGRSARVEAIAATLSDAGFDARLSDTILQAMWEKWVFIAGCAGITCLLRGTVGDIAAAGAADLASGLLDECNAIAAGQGYPPGEAATQRARALLTAPGSPLTASMFRDLENGGRIEADHIVGDLLRRGGSATLPLLRVVMAHLKTYEARRVREAG